MRLPITDEFLWKLYNFVEDLDKAYDFFAIRTPPEIVYPEMHRLKREYRRSQARTNFSQFIQNLQNRGYIRVKALKGTRGVILTQKGAERALRIKLKSVKKKRRKDNKWIMIIFDIPEKQRRARELFRNALINLGYQKLQKSVWVCHYDVHKETEEAIRAYRSIPYVKLFIIEEII